MGNTVSFDQKIADMPNIRVMQKSPLKNTFNSTETFNRGYK